LKISLDQLVSDHKEIYTFILAEGIKEENQFLTDVYKQLVKKKELSTIQLNAIRNSMLYYENKDKLEKLRIENGGNPEGNYVGKEKQRYDMTLKYISGKRTSRGFYIHNFLDKQNNSLMCFSDNERIYLDQEHKLIGGDCFTCRATVNRHSVNDFEPTKQFKQTVLNRIKYNKYLGNKRETNG
jgi:hypothetical protein